MLVGCIIHFGTIAAYNLSSYPVLHFPSFLYNKLIRSYAVISGIHVGYGFYSPTVGNVYQIQHHIQSDTNNSYRFHSPMQSAAAHMRYQSYLEVGAAWLSEKKENEATRELAYAVVIAANKQVAAQFPDAVITSTLMTRIIPTITKLQQQHILEPSYLSLFSYVEEPTHKP